MENFRMKNISKKPKKVRNGRNANQLAPNPNVDGRRPKMNRRLYKRPKFSARQQYNHTGRNKKSYYWSRYYKQYMAGTVADEQSDGENENGEDTSIYYEGRFNSQRYYDEQLLQDPSIDTIELARFCTHWTAICDREYEKFEAAEYERKMAEVAADLKAAALVHGYGYDPLMHERSYQQRFLIYVNIEDDRMSDMSSPERSSYDGDVVSAGSSDSTSSSKGDSGFSTYSNSITTYSTISSVSCLTSAESLEEISSDFLDELIRTDPPTTNSDIYDSILKLLQGMNDKN